MFLHVVLSRTLAGLSRLRGIGLSVVGGLIVVMGISPASGWDTTGVWALTYLLLAYCYVIGFFNLGESARRIRLLIELHGAGNRGMTLDEILAAYNARMIVEARLGRLLTGGQIVERGGRFVSKRSPLLYIAKMLVLLKILFLGARSEFGAR